MLKSPENFPSDKKEKEPAKVEWSPVEASERISIEREVILRSGTQDNLEWVKKNADKYRAILNDNKDSFLALHKEDPEALYALINQLLEKE